MHGLIRISKIKEKNILKIEVSQFYVLYLEFTISSIPENQTS